MLTETGDGASTATPTRTPPPEPVVVTNVWQLHADPTRLDRAAQAWRSITRAANTQADAVDKPAKKLYDGEWAGDTADSYNDHRQKLTRDVRAVATQSKVAGDTLGVIAGTLRSAQGLLDTSWDTLTATVPATVSGNNVTFRPADEAGITAINAAVKAANEIRSDVDDTLLKEVAAFERARTRFADITWAWESVAVGTTDGYQLPPEATNGTAVIYDPTTGNVIVNTGTGDDDVTITLDPKTGEQIVTVNGVPYRYPAGAHITVRAGEGNDTIEVPPGTRVNVVLLGGDGDDTVRGSQKDGEVHGSGGNEQILGGEGDDTIDAGEGNDRVSGGSGRDYITAYTGNDVVNGGTGDDAIYGGSGDDRILGGDDTISAANADAAGGTGRDYLEGGRGNDLLDGGAGADVVSGGRDNDVLRGGSGDDKVYAGRGTDTTAGGSGKDTVCSENGDHNDGAEHVVTVEIKDVGTSIKIDGSDEFRERVEDDLEMLRSSPTGRQMLADIDQTHNDSKGWFNDGNQLTIRETGDGNSMGEDGHLIGEDYTVNYNHNSRGPDYLPENVPNRPPIVGLYHEMGHVYDFSHDTELGGTYDPQGSSDPRVQRDRGVNVLERQATGLPVDHDEDPNTPQVVDPDHPMQYTENGLRDELGWPDRPSYREP